jgi:hypothetical protein
VLPDGAGLGVPVFLQPDNEQCGSDEKQQHGQRQQRSRDRFVSLMVSEPHVRPRLGDVALD